jgi:glutamate-1-semialdehyde 2,1-aminomutase
VGGTPIFFKKAKGSRLTDVDGKEYIDFVCSWGAIILGHADPFVVEAISAAAANGSSFGAPHEGEVRLAEQITARMPQVEKLRFVNSGSEATMSAIRVARAATGRNKIIKFDGNYHGAVDSLLAKAGSGVATFGLPDSAGVPASVVQDTLVAEYNNADQVEQLLSAAPGEVAAVLVEPVVGNMGCVPPLPGFLERLRELTTKNDTLLIFDEVMTGFRLSEGGAAGVFGITPDLICLGKVIGGGLPVGAYGGRRDLMDLVAPIGPVYQAGTLSGNSIAMAAGYAALSQLSAETYHRLEETGAYLESRLNAAIARLGKAWQVQRRGSMISVFLTDAPVKNFADADRTDRKLYGRIFHELLKRGVYLPPSALESWFFTLAHTRDDVNQTVSAFEEAARAALA